MTITTLAIVAALVAIVQQFIKDKINAYGNKGKLLVIVLTIIAGGIYYFIKDTIYWKTFLDILAYASLIWAFFIKDTGTNQ